MQKMRSWESKARQRIHPGLRVQRKKRGQARNIASGTYPEYYLCFPGSEYRRPTRSSGQVAQRGFSYRTRISNFKNSTNFWWQIVKSPTLVESQLRETVSDWMEKGRPALEGLGRTTQTALSCPSATYSHGDKVFAVFDEVAGALRYLPVAIDIPEIVKTTLDMDEFALKNRLEGRCVTSLCHYWHGACQLGHFISKVEVSVRKTSRNCAIKDTCRWLKENGPKVCGACAFVRNLPLTPPTNEND